MLKMRLTLDLFGNVTIEGRSNFPGSSNVINEDEDGWLSTDGLPSHSRNTDGLPRVYAKTRTLIID